MNKLLTLIASNTTAIGSSINKVGDDTNLIENIKSILTGIIVALGIVAVVVIIIGGINYMTSGGDSVKVKTAKNTILYGCIGLIICALAFAITNFVIMSLLKNS